MRLRLKWKKVSFDKYSYLFGEVNNLRLKTSSAELWQGSFGPDRQDQDNASLLQGQSIFS
jgi:hypothetical protein